MSGLYLLALIGIWLFVGWAIYRGWRRWSPMDLKSKVFHVAIGLLLFSLWFGGASWEVFGKKMYWDAKVRELCARDGGIKVYETVQLPAEQFDKYGNIGVSSKKYAKATDQYYYVIDERIIRNNDPRIIRYATRIMRRVDDKILGIAIRYGRGGGDLPGPWAASTYDCPSIENAEGKLEPSIFSKIGEK